jgi:hypothetical protein
MSIHTSEERIERGPGSISNGDPSWALEKTVFSEDPEQPAEPRIESDAPPDGGYGWVCVGCAFLINAHTWGVNSVGLSAPDLGH